MMVENFNFLFYFMWINKHYRLKQAYKTEYQTFGCSMESHILFSSEILASEFKSFPQRLKKIFFRFISTQIHDKILTYKKQL